MLASGRGVGWLFLVPCVAVNKGSTGPTVVSSLRPPVSHILIGLLHPSNTHQQLVTKAAAASP